MILRSITATSAGASGRRSASNGSRCGIASTPANRVHLVPERQPHLVGLEFGCTIAGMPCGESFSFWTTLNVAVPFIDHVIGVDGVSIFAIYAERSFPIWQTADISSHIGIAESGTVVVVSLKQLRPVFRVT